MKRITGFRRHRKTASQSAHAVSARWPRPARDQHAQDRVMGKIQAMGETFYSMSEDEYGAWIDALPYDEFVEFLSVMIELDDRDRQSKTSTR